MKLVLEKKKKSEPAVRKNRLFECSNRKVLKDRNSIIFFGGESRIFDNSKDWFT